MYKYPKIPIIGSEDCKDIFLYDNDIITIEEKVDGGNFSIFLEDNIIHHCTRNRDLTISLDNQTFGSFRMMLPMILKDKLNLDYIYYMEVMQKHTLTYTTFPPFIGLDIRVKKDINGGLGLFLPRKAKEKEFERIGIPVINLIIEKSALFVTKNYQ